MLTHGLRGVWLALTRTERAGLWPLWGGGARKGRVCGRSAGVRDERRLRRTLSRHLFISISAAQAAVSLLGGAAGIEETFDPVRSLMAACGLQSP